VNKKKHADTAEQTASKERLEFEKFLADLSARFVSLHPEQVDNEINNAMKGILGFFGVDRCSLLRLMPGKTLWLVTHNADILGDSPYPVETPLPTSLAPWFVRKLSVDHATVAFSCVEDLPEEAALDKQLLDLWNVRSGLYIPIAALKSSTEYTLGISSGENGRTCPEEYIPRLRMLGELFVNSLERSMAEQALRESEERLNLAASAAEAGLWIMDKGKGMIWTTRKLMELFHLDPDEGMQLESLLGVIHPDDREGVRERIQQSFEKNEAFAMDFRVVRPDGGFSWISSRGNLSSAGPGLPRLLTGASTDVTERKQMEVKLRENLEEVERLKLQLEKENLYLREEIKAGFGFEKIIGKSDALNYVFFKVKQVAPTDATVLILGETGTGKGMVAHAIHEMGSRGERPMITVNCAALPANLIESELFGREKGAFTGAHAKQVGRFELAHGGTLFLDEIGEMPLELQTKLLRVLQDGKFERLGSPQTIKVDVRVIAATSRDLKEEVRNRRFREDLFYRLNVFPISIPPLRMRRDDIPLLVQHFVIKHARKIGRRFETIPKNAMKALQDQPWPGNVRELEHAVERAVITSPGPVLQFSDGLETQAFEERGNPLKGLEAIEREHILKVLGGSGWKIDGAGGAASLLGLHPSTLRFRLKKLGIKRPQISKPQ